MSDCMKCQHYWNNGKDEDCEVRGWDLVRDSCPDYVGWGEAQDGMYLVKNGVTYKVEPRVKIPLAKKINLMTGEVTYPTNADRIRQMSDEELAEFLEERVSDVPWCNEEAPFKPGSDECALEDCTKCALDWLKQEVADGQTD